MRNSFCLFLFIAVGLYLNSCSCISVDCEEEDSLIFFSIIDKIDTSDLVFGANSIFKQEDISVFTLSALDTNFINVKRIISTSGDSLFAFRNDNFLLSRAFIDYGNLDIDTLDIFSTQFEDECCSLRKVTSIDQNGTEIFNFNMDFVALIKK